MSNKPMTDDEIREWLDKNKDSLTPGILFRKAYEQHTLREMEKQRKNETPAITLKDDTDTREIHELSPIELFMRGYLESPETDK